MIFDGREFARALNEMTKQKIQSLGIVPKLVWICVGQNEASRLYGRLKSEAAESLGIDFETVVMDAGVRAEELGGKIREFCNDVEVHGVMVQLPAQVEGDLYSALGEIRADKDVDCLNPYSVGRVMAGEVVLLPATVASVGQILVYGIGQTKAPLDIKDMLAMEKVLAGKRAVVIGGGWEVGKPLVALLSNWGATVVWARSSEENLAEIVKMGEIVISATGKENLINGAMLQDGAVVIDVGAPKGDVDFMSASAATGFVTPVPGGVGPVTVACLMANVVEAAGR